MSVQKPSILRMLSILAIIIGVYILVRGGLLTYESIRSWASGFSDIFELCIGVLSAAFGIFALMSGISVLRSRPGCIELLKKYAITLVAYQIIWIIFTVTSGRIVGWGSVLLDSAVGIGTFACIIMNVEVRNYPGSGGPEPDQ